MFCLVLRVFDIVFLIGDYAATASFSTAKLLRRDLQRFLELLPIFHLTGRNIQKPHVGEQEDLRLRPLLGVRFFRIF